MPSTPSHRHAVAPRPAWIGGGEEQRAAAHGVGDRHVERPVAPADRRRPRPAAGRDAVHLQLTGAGGDVTDQLPRDEVAAVVDRDAGEVLERRGRQVVVVADPHDGGVGMEPRDERVAELHRYLTEISSCTGRVDHARADEQRELARLPAPPLVPVGELAAADGTATSADRPATRCTSAKPTSQRAGRSTADIGALGVDLHDLLARTIAGVGHVGGDDRVLAGTDHRGRGGRVDRPRGVAETEAEGVGPRSRRCAATPGSRCGCPRRRRPCRRSGSRR